MRGSNVNSRDRAQTAAGLVSPQVIPIQALLSRLRHDPAFARGRWEIAYLDRALPSLVRLPLEAVHTRAHIGFVFDVVDEEGVARTIPYHRVRQVWHDGKVVWSRTGARPREKEPKPRPARRQPSQQPRMRR
jgi:uncharacterized protein (UPF0248 family)